MIRDTARDFAAREVAPKAAELDKTGRWPAEIVAKMAELGLLGVAIPQEHGGAGMDTLSYALAMEEVSAACASSGVIMSVNNSLFCDPVYKFGTDEQKKRVLAPVARGKKLGCFGLTEPMSGSDAQTMVTGAEKTSGGWVLERGEELDHQRPARRLDPRLRRHRPQRPQGEAHGLPRRARDAGVHAERRRPQARHPRRALVHRVLRGLQGARRERRGRRGRRLQGRDGDARRRAHRHRVPGHRHRARRVRAQRGLRQGAQELRRPHRAAPGHPVHAGRHGDADRRRAPARRGARRR